MFQNRLNFRAVVRGLVFLSLIVAGGTLWFAVVEGYNVIDALYMTVITLSTVGFKEVHPLDASGRLFTTVLIILGLTVLTYTLGSLGALVVEGTFQRIIGRQRMMREIDNLKRHYVVCGHGRMGRILCEQLVEEKVPFVVVENDPEVLEDIRERGYKLIEGDATEDEVLVRAGIERAKGLVAVVSSNESNLYISLSAREICRRTNADLYILSRATGRQAAQKIYRAGADRVISPYVIGGMRFVQALLRPSVYDFVDVATQSGGLDLMFEEITIGPDAHLDGVALRDSEIRGRYDIIVIAIKKPDGTMRFNPGPDSVLETDDVLITLGEKEQLDRLQSALA
jgi:voltage-gated potassium channel